MYITCHDSYMKRIEQINRTKHLSSEQYNIKKATYKGEEKFAKCNNWWNIKSKCIYFDSLLFIGQSYMTGQILIVYICVSVVMVDRGC